MTPTTTHPSSTSTSTPTRPPSPKRKRTTTHPSSSSHQSQPQPQPPRPTINLVKKRRRDLHRLLTRTGDALPADVRAAHERELAACEDEITEARDTAARRAMIGKYHMVRFFERKKATRLLKRARQRLAQAQTNTQSQTHSDPAATTNTTNPGALASQVHMREVDLNYTLYYPLDSVYTSLYARSSNGNSSSSNPTPTNPHPTNETTTADAHAQELTSGKGGAEEEDRALDADGQNADDNDNDNDFGDTSNAPNRSSPMWSLVEESMVLGVGRLQMLRNGKLTPKAKVEAVAKPSGKIAGGKPSGKTGTGQKASGSTQTHGKISNGTNTNAHINSTTTATATATETNTAQQRALPNPHLQQLHQPPHSSDTNPNPAASNGVGPNPNPTGLNRRARRRLARGEWAGDRSRSGAVWDMDISMRGHVRGKERKGGDSDEDDDGDGRGFFES